MPGTNIEQAFQIAVAHYQAGRLAEAEAVCRQVLAVHAHHADALNLLWAITSTTGRNEEAMHLVLKGIALWPARAAYHSDLGVIFRNLGRFEEAVASHCRALALAPDSPEICLKLGDSLQASGRSDEAVVYLERALALRPDYAAAHNNRGNILMEKAQWQQAVLCYQRALALEPNFMEAQVNLGRVLLKAGRLDEAIASCNRAVVLQPNLAAAHNNLGNALAEHGRLADALASYRQAIALQPAHADAHTNLGNVYLKMRQWDNAMASYRKALACRQDFADAHWNLALLLLVLGRYEEGWKEYEWRWRYSGFGDERRNFSAPQWDGRRASGRTIFLHAEQGFGDTIQFLRYAPLVCEHAGAGCVFLECPPELERLLAHAHAGGWKVRLVPRKGPPGTALPPFDFHIPMLSLPLSLGLFDPRHPALPSGPYLCAEPELRALWRERLGTASALRVGLVWAGRPTHKEDSHRSIQFQKLLPLLHVQGVLFYSLQIAQSREQLAALAEAGATDLTAHITDFADTAALMAGLDLIITVDTATAHLAGALGRPVWTLLPFVPDWRWGLEREDTPWYPTMRLFRQPAIGDWDSVIARVAAELCAMRDAQGGILRA